MASFVVMRGQNDSANDDVHFVRDGFAAFALAVPLFWLIWHRLWLHAAVWFGFSGAIAALVYWSANSLALSAALIATLSTNLLVALDGGDWIKQKLERKGYVESGIISARFQSGAEEVFASRLVNSPLQKPAPSFAPITNLIPLNGSH